MHEIHRRRSTLFVISVYVALLICFILVKDDLQIKFHFKFKSDPNESYQTKEILKDVEILTYFNKTLNGRGVILSVKGGLGNQLFQFACSYGLARDHQSSLYYFLKKPELLSESSLSRKFSSTDRDYALDKFQIPQMSFIDNTTVINPSQIGYLKDSEVFYRNYSVKNKPFLQNHGYCISEAYFSRYKNEILEMVQLRPEVIQGFRNRPYVGRILQEIMDSKESVAVHVRRGDYSRKYGYDIPISYHRLAIHRMLNISRVRTKSIPKFFVFSDNISYTREKLADLAKLHQFVFVSSSDGNGDMNGTTSLEDFYLMTRCKHFIIGTSTFAWWAAYSGTEWRKRSSVSKSKSDRIVIASTFNPKYWDHWKINEVRPFYKMVHAKYYYPKEWIVINPFNGEP